MALPKILLGDGKIAVLSGFQEANSSSAVSAVIPDFRREPKPSRTKS